MAAAPYHRFLQGFLLVLAASSVVPEYWDIFPYVYWYYRYYNPRGLSRGPVYGRLVDNNGRLRLDEVGGMGTGTAAGTGTGRAVPEAKQGTPISCYQCQSSPRDAYVYNVAKVPRTLTYPYAPAGRRHQTVYVTKLVRTSERRAGLGDCHNGFPHQVAGLSSIKEVTCRGRCYVKVANNKEISRGCLRKNHYSSHKRAGCYNQGGARYCVCDGNKCNNGDPPSN